MINLEKIEELILPVRHCPHPCTGRCWRIGAAANIDEHGNCEECGQPDITYPSTDDKNKAILAIPELIKEIRRLRDNFNKEKIRNHIIKAMKRYHTKEWSSYNTECAINEILLSLGFDK